MNHVDKQYIEHLGALVTKGKAKGDRTGTGTMSLFGHQMRFDLTKGFPLLTTKKLFTKGIVHELIMFIRGETNIQRLVDNGVGIWDEWATEEGDLGPVYGEQWRSWKVDQVLEQEGEESASVVRYTIDQLAEAIATLKINPDSRRIIVSAWNPAVLPDDRISPQENAKLGKQALPPCHTLFQFYTEEIDLSERFALFRTQFQDKLFRDEEWVAKCKADKKDIFVEAENIYANFLESQPKNDVSFLNREGIPSRYLSCQLYQRSADWFLGVPFNIASYALLTEMIAQVTGMKAKEFIHSFGDTHVYLNHLEQVTTQLKRQPFNNLPKLKLNPAITNIDDFEFEDITIEGYTSHEAIKAPVSV